MRKRPPFLFLSLRAAPVISVLFHILPHSWTQPLMDVPGAAPAVRSPFNPMEHDGSLKVGFWCPTSKSIVGLYSSN